MIHVAAVILTDEAGKILICKRGEGGSCAFLWEFPGGKLEEGESPEQAAVRELSLIHISRKAASTASPATRYAPPSP